MKLIKDIWLSNIFNYNVFRVDISGNDSIVLPETKSFIWAKIPTEKVEIVSSFSALNFRVVDVNVTFEMNKKNIRIDDKDNLTISEFMVTDEEQVLKIAENSFVFSRFHLDPNISNSIANLIKKLWIKNYIEKKRGERLLVIKYKNDVAGFLAELTTKSNDKSIGIIDLISIDKNFQGLGLGKSLVNYWIDDCHKKYEILRVGTQIANIPSIRLYHNCGFQISDAQYIMHLHLT